LRDKIALLGILLETMNLSALFFIGFAFPFGRSQKRLLLFMEFNLLLSLFQTGVTFLIQQSRFLGWPALLIEVGYLNLPAVLFLGNAHYIADFYFFAGLAALSIDVNLAATHSIGCQTAGFEKPRSPQPLIDTNTRQFTQAAARFLPML